MTEETNPVAAEVITSATTEAPDNSQELSLRCGFVVGLDQDDRFVFNMMGEPAPGVLELLGLLGYAENHIQKLVNDALGVGDKLTINIAQSAVQAIMTKLNAIETRLPVPPEEVVPELVTDEGVTPPSDE